jgi:hypothetical protein
MMEFINGKDDIPYMKWKITFMFQTTNLFQCFFLIGQAGGSAPNPIGVRTKCSSKSTDSIWTKRSVNLGWAKHISSTLA